MKNNAIHIEMVEACTIVTVVTIRNVNRENI